MYHKIDLWDAPGTKIYTLINALFNNKVNLTVLKHQNWCHLGLHKFMLPI